MKAMTIHRNGGPEVLHWEDVDLPPPGPGQVRIRHTAIALNFSDINVRRGGFYIAKPLVFPVILGNEAAGIVVSTGPGVADYTPGMRVGYVGVGGPFYENTGAYCEERNVPASCLVRLPDGISDAQAAAVMLKGLTAACMINRIWRPKAGDPVLIHAAASGVGILLSQWLSHLGAQVLGTVGSQQKAEFVKQNGCAHPILYRQSDFVAEVKKIVPQGVAAVFDGVGQDTFMASLDCVRPFGMLINYGNASGHVPPLDLLLLAKKGSLSVSRPAFSSYIADPQEMRQNFAELFNLLINGVLKVEVSQTYRLQDVARAHQDLESRAFVGSAVIIP
ncbi:MAG: quinone oxidoreductase [Alphaproteobacteria bacterium]|nr:quinone oxidoreductase [Alphaproteobacteria bacterium]